MQRDKPVSGNQYAKKHQHPFGVVGEGWVGETLYHHSLMAMAVTRMFNSEILEKDIAKTLDTGT